MKEDRNDDEGTTAGGKKEPIRLILECRKEEKF
jgi:hypothetical protein